MKLFDELKRRNVFRVAGIYAVAGWVVAQVAGILETSLNMPGWFDSVIVSALLLGFPVAIILAWAFEMTPEGVKLTANVPAGESIAPKTGRRIDYAVLAGVGLVAVLFIYDRLTPEKPAAPTQAAPADLAAAAPTPPDAEADTEAAPTPPPAASIAVLPFADLSPGKDQEYFSDGMAEEILNVLARVDGLTVASRTSSFAFKGQDTLGIPAIAKELNVRHILEGSVRKAGGTIRITAQLIDSTSDKHAWSETFDRPLTADNVFTIQDEIAQAIVGALGGMMTAPGAAAPALAVEKSTADLSAYDLYLQARALYQRRENLDEAEALLAKAVDRDPNFADAWALRAATASLFKEYLQTDRTYEDYGKLVDAYADRALALNPDSARAIAARANFQMNATWSVALRCDIAAVIADFKRAIALDPRDSSAMNWLGLAYAWVGESGKAAETFAACEAFDPYFGPCAENYYDALFTMGRFDEAFTQYQQVLAKGIVVTGWANFSMLAHLDQKTAFMQASNHPAWMPGWRGHEDLYEAFKRPDDDHSALVAEIREFVRTLPQRRSNRVNNLLFPIGGFDATPHPITLWNPGHARYRRSPQFKTYIRDIGIHDYWRKHGFPPQCKPVGKDDFACE